MLISKPNQAKLYIIFRKIRMLNKQKNGICDRL